MGCFHHHPGSCGDPSSFCISPPASLLLGAWDLLIRRGVAVSNIFNVFKEEIPSDKESSYPAFISGAALTTVVLVIMALLKE